jgi:hypothetical protein
MQIPIFSRQFDPGDDFGRQAVDDLGDYYYRCGADLPREDREDVTAEALKKSWRKLKRADCLVNMFDNTLEPSDEALYSQSPDRGPWFRNRVISDRIYRDCRFEHEKRRARLPKTAPMGEEDGESGSRKYDPERWTIMRQQLRKAYDSLDGLRRDVLWTCTFWVFDDMYRCDPTLLSVIRLHPEDLGRALPERVDLWASKETAFPAVVDRDRYEKALAALRGALEV